eukprot:Skav211534  [mRNA]  locus=scaffold352:449217:454147:- [translate_table: standard]
MQVPGYEHSLIVKNTFIDIFEEKADETREPRSLSEPPAARPAIESGEAQNTPEALCRMQSLEQEQPMPGACPDWSMRQAPCSSTGSASHLDHLSLQEIAFPDEELLSECLGFHGRESKAIDQQRHQLLRELVSKMIDSASGYRPTTGLPRSSAEDAKKRRNRLQLEKRKQPRPQLSSPPEE